MYSIKRTPLAAAVLLALNSPFYSPTATAVPAPVFGTVAGDEFRVNTETSLSQESPSIAMDANGNFVVAWQSDSQTGDSSIGIYAQRYHADGTVNGGEFHVNTYTTGDQTNPKVAMDATGDFVIVWEDSAQDGDGLGVYAQRYHADGTVNGGEFRVNTYTVGIQFTPDVAMDAGGDFVVAWDSCTASCATNAVSQDGSYDGIFAQRYDADGNKVAGEFTVNTTSTSEQSYPGIAMDAAGDFVVTWRSLGQEGAASEFGIYAQRYNATGNTVGNEFQVNTYTSKNQNYPSVAMDAAGDFVIAWQSKNQNGTGFSIYAQRYDATGVASTDGEFKVNTYTTSGVQTHPSVAMDSAGDFVVTWTSYGEDGSASASKGVYAQGYNADGTVNGDEFQVNSYVTNDQGSPGVAMDTTGDFVIAWQSSGQDDISNPSSYGVYAQRYTSTAATAAATIDLSLVVDDDTDPVNSGNNFVYSLITTNNGTGTAIDVNLSEPIPTGLTYVYDDSATNGWSCTQLATTLNCNKPSMTAGETSTIHVTVKATTAGELSNTVTVTSAQADTNPADNTDTETTRVNASGGGGSLSIFTLLLAIPLWLRRRFVKQ